MPLETYHRSRTSNRAMLCRELGAAHSGREFRTCLASRSSAFQRCATTTHENEWVTFKATPKIRRVTEAARMLFDDE